MTTLRSAGEIACGMLLAMGAVFNAAYMLRNGPDFYRSFADRAWSPQARRLVEMVVIPHATSITLALILFEATAAVLILLRGDLAQPALLAGAAFALVAATVSSPGGTVANVALAALMAALAVTR